MTLRQKKLIVSVAALGCLFAISGSSVVCLGQGVQIGFSNTTPSFNSGHDYIQQLNETVNPANGSLSIHIGIPTPNGRGLTFGYGLNYDSAARYDFFQPTNDLGFASTMTNEGSQTTDDGWSDTTPRLIVEHDLNPITGATGNPLICEVYSGFIFIDPNGERHSLPLLIYIPNFQGNGCYPNSYGTPVLAAADKEYQAVYDGSLKVASADGTIYEFPITYGGASTWPTGIITLNPQFVEDKNGNLVTVGNSSYTGNSGIGAGSPIIDSLNRTLVSVGSTEINGVPALAINVSGLSKPYLMTGDQPQSVTTSQIPASVLFPTIQNTTLYGNYNSCGINPNATLPIPSALPTTRIQLPNGQSYVIQYDPVSGNANKITYPTGGYVTYQWNIPGMTDDANYAWQLQLPYSPPGSVDSGDSTPAAQNYYCFMQYGLPAITHREVSFDGVNIVQTQDFAYQTTFGAANDTTGWKTKTTTVTTHDLLANTSSSIVYTYLPDFVGVSAYDTVIPKRYTGPAPQENLITYKDGNGNVIKTVQKVFVDDVLTSEVTQLASGLTSEKDYLYGGFAPTVLSSFTNSFTANEVGWMSWPAGTATYDWGNGTKGPLLTVTYSNFDDPRSIASTSVDLNEGPTILNEPSKTVTQDGSGHILAETDYVYTDSISQVLSGVVQHDPQFEGGTPQVRRNLLSATKKCFPNCADSTTTYAYDSTGQVVSVLDGRGSTTTLWYTDAFAPGTGTPTGNTNAYLTSVIRPTTNGVAHTSSYTYGYLDGERRTTTDENGGVTQYCYRDGGCSGSSSDPFNRLTEIIYPSGGGSQIVTYNDAGPSPSVVSVTAKDSTSNLITTTVSDGFGHATQTQANSDPDGTDFVDTSYNGLGLRQTASNAHRASYSTTDGSTSYIYDALGQMVSQKNSDNSIQQWCYNNVGFTSSSICSPNLTATVGTWVDYVDEAGIHTQRVSDGAGRLTAVVEGIVSGSSPLETDYTYDASNNLLNVNQKGIPTDTPRQRSFTYDSFSRLLTSTNAETGTICYGVWSGSSCVNGYDVNGNLLAKTDSRGFTTSYRYDALNRLIQTIVPLVNSSGAVANQYQSGCYQYDNMQGAPANANLVGRLVAEWTQSGNTCASSYTPSVAITAKVVLSYDAMGRPLLSQQCIKNMCQARPFTQSQAYDLAGNMTSWTDGRGLMTFTQQFDSAGRPVSLTNSVSGNGFPSILFSAQGYTAPGGLQNWNIGSYLNLFRQYDNRLRVISETVTH